MHSILKKAWGIFMQENTAEIKNHILNVDCRRQLSVSGVIDVVGFDETSIILTTEGGKLTVEGDGLHITSLDVESGKLVAAGRIDALIYSDKDEPRRGGFFSRLIK